MKSIVLILAVVCGCMPPAKTAKAPSCATACANMRALRCDLGMNTAEGSSCEEVCGNSQQILELAWDVRELTEADQCK